ncbi:MAG: hypothetical protein HQK52_21060 [Oligoflexia bacterium]|nr:hypothetical protein [Oligoflexia bacterium]
MRIKIFQMKMNSILCCFVLLLLSPTTTLSATVTNEEEKCIETTTTNNQSLSILSSLYQQVQDGITWIAHNKLKTAGCILAASAVTGITYYLCTHENGFSKLLAKSSSKVAENEAAVALMSKLITQGTAIFPQTRRDGKHAKLAAALRLSMNAVHALANPNSILLSLDSISSDLLLLSGVKSSKIATGRELAVGITQIALAYNHSPYLVGEAVFSLLHAAFTAPEQQEKIAKAVQVYHSLQALTNPNERPLEMLSLALKTVGLDEYRGVNITATLKTAQTLNQLSSTINKLPNVIEVVEETEQEYPMLSAEWIEQYLQENPQGLSRAELQLLAIKQKELLQKVDQQIKERITGEYAKSSGEFQKELQEQQKREEALPKHTLPKTIPEVTKHALHTLLTSKAKLDNLELSVKASAKHADVDALHGIEKSVGLGYDFQEKKADLFEVSSVSIEKQLAPYKNQSSITTKASLQHGSEVREIEEHTLGTSKATIAYSSEQLLYATHSSEAAVEKSVSTSFNKKVFSAKLTTPLEQNADDKKFSTEFEHSLVSHSNSKFAVDLSVKLKLEMHLQKLTEQELALRQARLQRLSDSLQEGF